MPKILVVDDEAKIREIVSEALSVNGHQVTTMPGAQEAVAAVAENVFDLVLLDIGLKDESGISALKVIRKSQAKLPIVIYSGLLTAEIEKEARIAGANDVLSKNVGLPQLVRQIEKILKAKDRIFDEVLAKEKKSILIVDDQDDIRSVLKDFFLSKNFEVFEAESGEKAIELVSCKDFSTVLLDVQMPGMTGIDTLRHLFKIKPGLGVVMVTGSQNHEDVNEAVKMGAYGYVLKPFEFLYLELVVMSKLTIAQSN